MGVDSNNCSALDGVHCQVCASIDNVNRAFQQHHLQLFHEVLRWLMLQSVHAV